MPKRKTLKDLLDTNKDVGASLLLKTLFPDRETDEAGATKGCDCPGCQHQRAMHGAATKAEAPSEPDAEGGLVQTIASLVVNNEIVSVGFTVPKQVDQQQRVAVRFSQDDIAEVLTADEARILGHALLAAANHID